MLDEPAVAALLVALVCPGEALIPRWTRVRLNDEHAPPTTASVSDAKGVRASPPKERGGVAEDLGQGRGRHGGVGVAEPTHDALVPEAKKGLHRGVYRRIQHARIVRLLRTEAAGAHGGGGATGEGRWEGCCIR